MRQTMRPVTLSRVAETAYFAEKVSSFSRHELAVILKSSEDRGKEIAEEVVNMGLLKKEDELYTKTTKCSKFLTLVRSNNWTGIHEMMMDYPFYQTFITILQGADPSNPEEILTLLQSSPIPFNQASRDVLCDWGERLAVYSAEYLHQSIFYCKTTRISTRSDLS